MIRRSPLALLLVALTVPVLACNKDKKEGDDAAAEAAAPVAVVDAAPEAEAPVATVSAAPLPTTTAPVAVKTAAPKPAAPDPPICAKARSAKARNSPAFTNLEAQCRAAGGSL